MPLPFRLLPLLLSTLFIALAQATTIVPVPMYGKLYVAPTGVLLVTTANGVFRNADGSKAFKKVRGVTGQWGGFKAGANGLFVITSDGIYRSTDTGVSWTRLGIGHALDAIDGKGRFYGCSNDSSKVELSEDGGKHWRAAASQPSPSSPGSFDCERVAASGAFLYVFSYGANYVSDDGGRRWKPLRGPAQPPITGNFIEYYPQPDGSLYAIVEDKGMYRSDDQGRHWKALFRHATSIPHKLHFIANSTMHMTCRDDSGFALCRSTDGKHLKRLPATSRDLSHVVLQPGPRGMMYGLINDTLTMVDARGIWWNLDL